jgi:Radical SAM superfamily/B12 binding domain
MDVALVGLVLRSVENLSLAALRVATERAGLSAAIVPFNGWREIDDTVSAILELRPRACGISIQTSESAAAALALAWHLRRRGFAGLLVAGGHFATLNAADILRSPAGIDVVVRFAGEAALVGLLRGEPLDALPGVIFRAPDGDIHEGAPATPPAGTITRDRNRALPVHLGFPAADLVSSRGCQAHCAYCCIAGASQLLREEARRGGGSLDEAVYHRVSVDAIADEIAALHREHGARVFNFMDDNVLPLDAAAASAWTSALADALARRRVGRIAFSLQVRADAITPEVADGLVALGLVRAYVGIDGYTPGHLRVLGRAAPADAGTRAVAELRARGVFTVCNALLIGPTFPFEVVRAEIEGLARHEHAPVHLLPVEVRAGTAYHATAARRGLLEGGFLFRHYRFEDARTALVGEVITSLPTRLAERSVPIALYDLGYNLGIARRLCPDADVSREAAIYARVTGEWNADQVRVLRAAAAAAVEGRDAVRALIAAEQPRVGAHDRALLDECDAALIAVERAASRAQRQVVHAHARGRLLSAVSLALGLAACSADTTDHQVHDLAGAGDLLGDQSASYFDLAGADLTPRACFTGCAPGATAEPPLSQIQACCQVSGELLITYDAHGSAVSFTDGTGGALSPSTTQCLQQFFAGLCFPSLACTTSPVTAHCWIA